MQNVIIIGGSPFTGKSTLARLLSSRLEYACISTDDIGATIRAINTNDPELNPNGSRSYEEYYLSESNEKLITDTELYHERLRPAVMCVIQSHMNSSPAVIEGWSMYPSWFEGDSNSPGRIWLVSDADTIHTRIINDKSFLQGHKQRTEIIDKYFGRCMWQNRKIEEEALRAHHAIIRIDKTITPHELLKKALEILEKESQG